MCARGCLGNGRPALPLLPRQHLPHAVDDRAVHPLDGRHDPLAQVRFLRSPTDQIADLSLDISAPDGGAAGTRGPPFPEGPLLYRAHEWTVRAPPATPRRRAAAPRSPQHHKAPPARVLSGAQLVEVNPRANRIPCGVASVPLDRAHALPLTTADGGDTAAGHVEDA